MSHNKKIGPNERGGGGVKTGSTDNDAFSIDPAWLVLTTCYWPFVEGLANQSKLNLETSFIVLCELDNYFLPATALSGSGARTFVHPLIFSPFSPLARQCEFWGLPDGVFLLSKWILLHELYVKNKDILILISQFWFMKERRLPLNIYSFKI